MKTAARTAVLGIAVAFLGGLGPPALAQQDGPSLAAADVSVTMRANGHDTVRGTFRLAAPVKPGTRIELLWMPRTDVVPGTLTATGLTDVGSARPGRIPAVIQPGGTEYTVQYDVRRDPSTRAVPLVIPDIPTDRSATVDIEVTVPEGQRLVGDSMPSLRAAPDRDRPTLVHHGGDLPTAVVAGYGSSATLTQGTVLSLGAAGFIAITVLFWFIGSARKEATSE